MGLPHGLVCSQTLSPQNTHYRCPIHLPNDERQLFLVVSRPGYGRKPWYLLTTEPIHTAEQAWQIEMSLRFTKSEIAFESLRLQAWEARLKFLLIASLAHAFLLSLPTNMDFLFSFISHNCHRTGKWSRDISAPLYRLRLALSRLWLAFRPHSLPTFLKFGLSHVLVHAGCLRPTATVLIYSSKSPSSSISSSSPSSSSGTYLTVSR